MSEIDLVHAKKILQKIFGLSRIDDDDPLLRLYALVHYANESDIADRSTGDDSTAIGEKLDAIVERLDAVETRLGKNKETDQFSRLRLFVERNEEVVDGYQVVVSETKNMLKKRIEEFDRYEKELTENLEKAIKILVAAAERFEASANGLDAATTRLDDMAKEQAKLTTGDAKGSPRFFK